MQELSCRGRDPHACLALLDKYRRPRTLHIKSARRAASDTFGNNALASYFCDLLL